MAQTEWSGDKVRSTFIEFFKSKSHNFIPSSSLLPHGDKTLLFTNAGMNQFKPIFLGNVDPTSDFASLRRAANSQKCIRAGGKHNDLDDVGADTYHHTFFEMLGNWSFGDYFKKEAITWAWELLTQVYKLDSSRLYATYFGGNEKLKLTPDEEARQLWLQYLPADRVLPFGMKENFWEMGESGPCGPCSEIHYDRVGGRNAAHLVNKDDPEVLEIWNLVFIQFNREEDGRLLELPAKHVDTGAGLERVTSVLQNRMSNYDTDLFTYIFEELQRVSGQRPYTGKIGKEDPDRIDTAYRVVADHIRTLTFAISDGIIPGPNDREYVLRRILRRAVRYGDLLGCPKEFFHKLVPLVVEKMGHVFPELKKDPQRVMRILLNEEKKFLRTWESGKRHFNDVAKKLKPGDTVPADQTFALHTTYGFPIDLTTKMAEDQGLRVIKTDFDKLMDEFKKASEKEKGHKADLTLDQHATTAMLSSSISRTDDSPKYKDEDIKAKLVAIWNGEEFLDEAGPEDGEEHSGTLGVVLDRTNFYAEQGGQIFDTGVIASAGFSFEVTNVQVSSGFVLHIGKLTHGRLAKGVEVELKVDWQRRKFVTANHTSTHILNFGLRKVLGPEVDQKGSYVHPEYFRFDFNSDRQVTAEELKKVSDIVNTQISAKLPVYSQSLELGKGQKIFGLRAVFGEVYPDPVKIVSVGKSLADVLADPSNPEWANFSIEFCGGTHLRNTSEVVAFEILSEEGLGQSTRRVECVTGKWAQQAVATAAEIQKKVDEAAQLSGQALNEVVAKLTQEVDRATIPAFSGRQLRQSLDKLREKVKESIKSAKSSASQDSDQYAHHVVEELTQKLSKWHVGVLNVGSNTVALTTAIKAIQEKHSQVPVLLISPDPEKKKVSLVAGVPEELHKKTGLNASDWAKEVALVLGGKGGGKPTTAQGAGPLLDKVSDASNAAVSYVSAKLN